MVFEITSIILILTSLFLKEPFDFVAYMYAIQYKNILKNRDQLIKLDLQNWYYKS